ncbi:hypothetical protein TgHK011_002502 [Trichoderma gracile]|nr:hypothetical protein TgHK011_002502 [Trichoderma gracile]
MHLDRTGPCRCHWDPLSSTTCAPLLRSGSQKGSPKRKIIQHGKDCVAIMLAPARHPVERHSAAEVVPRLTQSQDVKHIIKATPANNDRLPLLWSNGRL